jgi:hypothetical protein
MTEVGQAGKPIDGPVQETRPHSRPGDGQFLGTGERREGAVENDYRFPSGCAAGSLGCEGKQLAADCSPGSAVGAEGQA